MAAQPGPDPWADTITAKVQFTIAGHSVRGEFPVPRGRVRPLTVLPVFQALAEVVVDKGVKAVQAEGKAVSCQAGCGACCRQLVPISETEACRLRELLDELPVERREVIRARFAGARRRLDEAGLLDTLLHPDRLTDAERRQLGLDYFRQRVACPFLDQESCSIYADRPIACREYLVTSPAENCAQPSAETVQCVPIPGKVSNAVSRLGRDPADRSTPWVPLVLAPEWADAHPDGPPTRTGPEIVEEVFRRLAGR